jgi:protein involved in polysaccharide export with SLBB domain
MLPIRSTQLALTQKAHRHGGWLAALALVLSMLSSGCAALTNPVYEGIPARRLPPEYLAKSRDELKTIPLTLLAQPQPEAYRLDAEDALAIYIEGVLPPADSGPPPIQARTEGNLPPAVGYPVVVREDGTLTLPWVKPFQVKGKTTAEVRDMIVKAYTIEKEILKPGKEQILVSLMRPRSVRVQVIRQDTGAIAVGNGAIGSTRRGTGASLDLPAYQNDVLNALSTTGGFPGLDAINEVLIQRNDPDPAVNRASPKIVRIPLRMRDGDTIPFRPEDVILKKGDIVFIEARDTEVYYTGGILQSHQFTLPRDYDLRVTDAITIASGPYLNGNFAQNSFSSSIVESGLGSASPSRVTVLRRTKLNGQIPIIVDLNVAARDPRENIIIMPGDTIIMQETVGEASTRYFTSIVGYTGTLFNTGSRGAISTSIHGP